MTIKPGDLNIADMWEALSDIFAADPALMHRAIDGSGIDWTWADFERDASRLAGHLVSSGLGPDSKVAFYLHNGPEYLIGTFAAFKIRGVPVNVNYRYEQSELRYLLTNSDAEAVLCNADLLPRVHSLLDEVSALRTVIVVDDLAQPAESIYYSHDRVNIVSWATALDAAPADRRTDRTGDDLWFLYTGGTTGMPKGVMWPHRSLLISWKGSFKVLGLELPSTIDELIEGMRTQPIEARQRILPAAPLMHGTSAMTAMSALCAGGSVVTLTNRSFDGDALWREIESRRVTHATIVGDAFAKPMLAAFDAATEACTSPDIASLKVIYSSGTMWSAPVKDALLERADLVLADLVGSSEGVGFASSVAKRNRNIGTARFRLGEFAQVIRPDGEPVEPGSGEVGVLAVGGPIPVGYYKDPEKTAATFQRIGDRVWSIPGDHATVESDGTIRLLGRGSVCINTGGEKVFPEEVEEVAKTHSAVKDCNVVGLPDEKWGQAICAVVELESGASLSSDDLRAHIRAELAGYKVPKSVVFVDRLQRSPNGKSDYRWAQSVAESQVV